MEAFKDKFIVGTDFIYGWDFVWHTHTEDCQVIPLVYDTLAAAQEAITGDIQEIEDAIEGGHMEADSATTIKDYIICMADMDSEGNVTVTFPQTHEQKKFNIKDQY
jgi:hypothetical protein